MTAEDLHHEAATGNYDILHFIGHGFWDAESGKSGLVLEDGKRGPFFLEIAACARSYRGERSAWCF